MCGIVGMFGGGGDPAERAALVHAMRTRIQHRGPDGVGLFQGEAQGEAADLGHARLAIIDLVHGAQPMISADQRWVLVFNGEIYNFIELRQQLVQDGVTFRTFSDAEVLVELLARRGVEALGALNGMFALALYDRQTGEWLLVRDPFGVKPLYWTRVGDQLLFASEIKAFLGHPGFIPEVDDAGMQEYLTFQFCLAERTLFKGVHRVPPATLVRGRGAEVVEQRRYWTASYRIDEDHTENYFIEMLRSLLEDSARLQIRSDVKLGAYLSGGMDSSVVASLAARYRGGPVPFFHGRFAEGPQYDESRWARVVAQHCGAQLHEVVITAQDFATEMPRLIYLLDEPLAGPGLLPQFCVSRLAAGSVKVVLGGQGGDEIFGGYARYLAGYFEQALKGAIFETQEEGRHLVTLQSIVANLPMLRGYEPMLQNFWRSGLFEPMDRRYFRLIDRSPDLDAILTPEARARVDRQATFDEFAAIFNDPDTQSYINKMTHFDQQTLLPALLQVEDRVSMGVSIEARVPLLDTRIVELVASMPPALKFARGSSKHVLKKAVSTLLPPEILSRKDKMGFPVPLGEWLGGGPVRDLVADTVLDRRARERGLFEPKAVENLLRAEAPFGRQLWGVLSLELWFRSYFDRRGEW